MSPWVKVPESLTRKDVVWLWVLKFLCSGVDGHGWRAGTGARNSFSDIYVIKVMKTLDKT